MKNILFLIVTILIAVLLFSCNSSKRIAKKNQAAVDRVKSDINLLNDVGEAWQKLNPCYPDTIRIGKTITTIDSSYAKESIEELNNTIDSILSNYPNKNIDSLKEAIRKEVQAKCKPITIYKYRIDTLPRDKRYEDALNSKLQSANIQISNQEGQITQLQVDKSELKKDSKKKTWLIGGISVFALLVISGLIYLLFQKKLL